MSDEVVDHNLASWFDRMYSFHFTNDVNIMPKVIFNSYLKL